MDEISEHLQSCYLTCKIMKIFLLSNGPSKKIKKKTYFSDFNALLTITYRGRILRRLSWDWL